MLRAVTGQLLTATRAGTGRPERTSRSTPHAWPARWWPVAYGAALGAALFLLARHALPDDGLISLSYARNLAEHGQWAISTSVTSNSATSPLNVWLLAALYLATGGHAFVAAALLLMASLAGVATNLRRLGGAPAGLIGTALLATSPVLTSSLGLETFLCAALLVGVVRCGVEGRWVLTGVLTGAAYLGRPDMTVPAVAAVLVLAVTHRRLLRALPLGAAVTLPWVLFSWWHFGSAWSNSVAVKWANGSWGGNTLFTWTYWWADGAGQYSASILTVVATVVLGLVATVVAVVRRQEAAAALGVAGAAHLGALACTVTPPIEYYLGPAITGLGLAAVLVAARMPRPALAAPALLVVSGVVLSVAHGSLWSQGYAPMRQNIATDAQYAEIVRRLPTDGAVMGGEIGAYSFYCQDRVPACTVVDPVLSDPARVDGLVSQWRRFHPGWELNYRHYEVPAPTPVRYRIALDGSPEPGDWMIGVTADGAPRWARLVAEPDPSVAK